MKNLKITEGIHGTWYYHLSRSDQTRSLCGKPVMPTRLPLDSWGTVTHIKERYCSQCQQKADIPRRR
jgi:hypothetical protein